MKQLEADERPEIVALLQQQKMMDKLTAIRSMPVDERAAAISEVFTNIEENGLTVGLYSAMSSAGRSIGAKDADAGVAFYNRLADAMEKSCLLYTSDAADE